MRSDRLTNAEGMLGRLARAEGQIRAVQRMIREGHDCERVAQQLSAARRALDKAFAEMIGCMVEHDMAAEQIKSLLVRYS